MAQRPTITSLTVERDRLARQLNDARDSIESLKKIASEPLKAVEEYKADLAQRAHEYADEQEFCEQFDDAMEELGLPRRSPVYDVTIRFQVRADSKLEAAKTVYEVVNETTAPKKAEDSLTPHPPESLTGWRESISAASEWWEVTAVNEQ